MIIIGGGSAGLFCAINRAKRNLQRGIIERIIVVEEHKEFGLPVQCTGIVTNEIYSIINKNDVDEFVINKISKTTIYSKSNQVTLDVAENIIIDNVKFINYLLKKALDLGVELLAYHRYISNTNNKILLKNLETNHEFILEDKFLIGADGPLSRVAKVNNLCTNRKHLIGIQARIKTTTEHNSIEFYPGVGEYAWCVPESQNICRVGVAIKLEKANTLRKIQDNTKKNNKIKDNKLNQSNKDETQNKNIEHNKTNNEIFENFLSKFSGKRLETQGGLIPIYQPRQKIIMHKKDFTVALIGDAALQIKNTTGGGIIPGLKAAIALSDDEKKYKKNLRAINRELYWHYILHNGFTKYDDDDWARLIAKTNHKHIKNILNKKNRDNLSSMFLSLAKSPAMIAEAFRVAIKIAKR